MSKRVKVLISVLVVALLLTVGATTVMAEGEEETAPFLVYNSAYRLIPINY